MTDIVRQGRPGGGRTGVRNTAEVGIVNVVRTASKGKAFKGMRIVLAGV